MFSRVIALLLAIVLFWSAFATQEQVGLLASSNVEQADARLPSEMPMHVHNGSIDDHHLDDQPAQAQSEGVMESLPLVLACPDAQAPALTMARPRPYAVAAWSTPYLDGPQRPPCRTHLVA